MVLPLHFRHFPDTSRTSNSTQSSTEPCHHQPSSRLAEESLLTLGEEDADFRQSSLHCHPLPSCDMAKVEEYLESFIQD